MTLAELRELGLPIHADAHARLTTFVERLLSENEHINLTAVRDADDAWLVHVCESLTLLALLDEQQPSSLLDLGTGGGVPGLPLACARPELPVTLLDATRKKVEAADRIAGAIGLQNVKCIWGRAELQAHHPALREQFDVVVSRAVARLPLLVEFAAGFVRVGGRCLFFKTPGAMESEAREAAAALRACRLKFERAMSYSLGSHGERLIAIYRKTAPLPPNLPRPPGHAKKKPL